MMREVPARQTGWERQGCGQPAEKVHCRDGIIDHQAAKAADAAFIRNALSGCQFHGSNVVNSWILVRPETIRSSTSVGRFCQVWRHRNEFSNVPACIALSAPDPDCTRLECIDGITHSGIFGASS